MDRRCFKKSGEELQQYIAFRRRGSKVNNKKGILYEYYRHDYEKTGRLYDIELKVYKNNNISDNKPLFETKFVQNINVD